LSFRSVSTRPDARGRGGKLNRLRAEPAARLSLGLRRARETGGPPLRLAPADNGERGAYHAHTRARPPRGRVRRDAAGGGERGTRLGHGARSASRDDRRGRGTQLTLAATRRRYGRRPDSRRAAFPGGSSPFRARFRPGVRWARSLSTWSAVKTVPRPRPPARGRRCERGGAGLDASRDAPRPAAPLRSLQRPAVRVGI
jgi:hypothetical protein